MKQINEMMDSRGKEGGGGRIRPTAALNTSNQLVGHLVVLCLPKIRPRKLNLFVIADFDRIRGTVFGIAVMQTKQCRFNLATTRSVRYI